jgi:splicing factor 3A subunit 3
MSSSVLEQLRAEQEDVESYERAIVSILNEKPRNVSSCRLCRF